MHSTGPWEPANAVHQDWSEGTEHHAHVLSPGQGIPGLHPLAAPRPPCQALPASMGTQVSAAQRPTPPAWLCLTCPALRPHCQGSAGVLIPAAQLGCGVALCPATAPFPGWVWEVSRAPLDSDTHEAGWSEDMAVPGQERGAGTHASPWHQRCCSRKDTFSNVHPAPSMSPPCDPAGMSSATVTLPIPEAPQVDCAEPQHLPTSSSLQNPFFP